MFFLPALLHTQGESVIIILRRNIMNIVFLGDSITDAHRDRADERRPFALGMGYPLLTASVLGEKYPDRDLRFWNRGISGDKVTDLLSRWRRDCVHMEPDVLVLFVGINDVWHEDETGNGTDLDVFSEVYKILLDKAYEANENLKVILIEPFCIGGFGVVKDSWPHKVYLETREIRKLAEDYMVDAVIPAQDLFDEAIKVGGPGHWTIDGVHPHPAGHMLLAKAVIEELEKMMAEEEI